MKKMWDVVVDGQTAIIVDVGSGRGIARAVAGERGFEGEFMERVAGPLKFLVEKANIGYADKKNKELEKLCRMSLAAAEKFHDWSLVGGSEADARLAVIGLIEPLRAALGPEVDNSCGATYVLGKKWSLVGGRDVLGVCSKDKGHEGPHGAYRPDLPPRGFIDWPAEAEEEPLSLEVPALSFKDVGAMHAKFFPLSGRGPRQPASNFCQVDETELLALIHAAESGFLERQHRLKLGRQITRAGRMLDEHIKSFEGVANDLKNRGYDGDLHANVARVLADVKAEMIGESPAPEPLAFFSEGNNWVKPRDYAAEMKENLKPATLSPESALVTLVKELSKRVEEHSSRINALEDTLVTFEKTYKTQLDALEKRLRAIEWPRQAMQERIELLERRLAEAFAAAAPVAIKESQRQVPSVGGMNLSEMLKNNSEFRKLEIPYFIGPGIDLAELHARALEFASKVEPPAPPLSGDAITARLATLLREFHVQECNRDLSEAEVEARMFLEALKHGNRESSMRHAFRLIYGEK